MSMVWDNCTSCYSNLPSSQKKNDWRKCKRCLFVERSVFLGLIIALLLVWRASFALRPFSHDTLIFAFGYSSDIVGGWFLATGYGDLFTMASQGWGGADGIYEIYGPKHFRKRILGLIFLTIGFLLQALASIK